MPAKALSTLINDYNNLRMNECPDNAPWRDDLIRMVQEEVRQLQADSEKLQQIRKLVTAK